MSCNPLHPTWNQIIATSGQASIDCASSITDYNQRKIMLATISQEFARKGSLANAKKAAFAIHGDAAHNSPLHQIADVCDKLWKLSLPSGSSQDTGDFSQIMRFYSKESDMTYASCVEAIINASVSIEDFQTAISLITHICSSEKRREYFKKVFMLITDMSRSDQDIFFKLVTNYNNDEIIFSFIEVLCEKKEYARGWAIIDTLHQVTEKFTLTFNHEYRRVSNSFEKIADSTEKVAAFAKILDTIDSDNCVRDVVNRVRELTTKHETTQGFRVIMQMSPSDEQYKENIEAASKMNYVWQTSIVYEDIVRTMALKGHIKVALQTIRTLKFEDRQGEALAIISQATKTTDYDKEIFQMAETLSGKYARSQAFFGIVRTCIARGDFEKALEITTTKVECHNRAILHKEIAIAMASKGDIEKALQLTEGIKSQELQEQTLCCIGNCIAKTSLSREATFVPNLTQMVNSLSFYEIPKKRFLSGIKPDIAFSK